MKQGGMFSGIVTLIALFGSLCLLILAVLSYTTAENEWKLSEITLQQAGDFYQAERIAAERLAEWNHEDGEEGETETFEIPAGERLALEVSARRINGQMIIMSWKTVYRGTWGDENAVLQVWSGGSMDE